MKLMVFKPWKNVCPALGLLPVVQRAMQLAHPVTASGDVIPERKCLAVERRQREDLSAEMIKKIYGQCPVLPRIWGQRRGGVS